MASVYTRVDHYTILRGFGALGLGIRKPESGVDPLYNRPAGREQIKQIDDKIRYQSQSSSSLFFLSDSVRYCIKRVLSLKRGLA